MKTNPVNQVIDKAINEIKALDSRLDTVNTNKLVSDLWDFESKTKSLRNFILNKVTRTA